MLASMHSKTLCTLAKEVHCVFISETSGSQKQLQLVQKKDHRTPRALVSLAGSPSLVQYRFLCGTSTGLSICEFFFFFFFFFHNLQASRGNHHDRCEEVSWFLFSIK
eukprot:TRINITY_DN4626_c2_g1_i3.p2 TRINITY_DN4626_c2_g1~~TRINITY_DN4626_c2_g1_i3.p2  ORF type:complete len:107 (-),score=12.63 TRINITY_DN4626_c2_g1_i3:151-471(-)